MLQKLLGTAGIFIRNLFYFHQDVIQSGHESIATLQDAQNAAATVALQKLLDADHELSGRLPRGFQRLWLELTSTGVHAAAALDVTGL